MPHDGQLPIACPHCHNNLATLTVRSQTIVTVTCANCGHTWALELATMPEAARHAAEVVARERETPH